MLRVQPVSTRIRMSRAEGVESEIDASMCGVGSLRGVESSLAPRARQDEYFSA
jgi:hypothetical protein